VTTVFLHGFLGDHRDAGPLVEGCPDSVVLELPGHGAAPAATGGLWDTARRLWQQLDARGLRCVTLCGYSLGGRLALHLALLCPERCSRLVVVSASPGLRAPSEREARALADDALADTLEREGLPRFVERWYAQPLFAPLRARSDALALVARRCEGDPGRLAAALRHLSVGRQEDLWPLLPRLTMPSLWLAGARDPKYVAIAKEAAATARGQALIVPDAGHALWHEAPAALLAVLRSDGSPPVGRRPSP
jgi:2-succinyl-6-hydroxy-2,4-cyclohexadiene-1-carboxylate synthase